MGGKAEWITAEGYTTYLISRMGLCITMMQTAQEFE